MRPVRASSAKPSFPEVTYITPLITSGVTSSVCELSEWKTQWARSMPTFATLIWSRLEYRRPEKSPLYDGQFAPGGDARKSLSVTLIPPCGTVTDWPAVEDTAKHR